MKLLEKSGRTLKHIGVRVFLLEKDIQNIIEENVDIIFGLSLFNQSSQLIVFEKIRTGTFLTD